MSQPDLLEILRAARPTAPPELRERLHAISAAAAPTPPRKRLTWQRASFALVPALGALVVAAVILGHDRSSTNNAARETGAGASLTPQAATPSAKGQIAPTRDATAGSARLHATALAPTPGRVVRYSASLELRLGTADAVSRAAQRGVRIARALGGFPASVDVQARGRQANASLVLRVPRAHVQSAIERLSVLGTIVGEDVSLQDLEAGLNGTDRTIARLQERLRVLRAQQQTTETTRAIATTTAHIERLQRESAGTRRGAHYATVALQLHTPQPVADDARDPSGPLHGLGVAFRWFGIGTIYALALGGPLVAILLLGLLVARIVRRRREDALLNAG